MDFIKKLTLADFLAGIDDEACAASTRGDAFFDDAGLGGFAVGALGVGGAGAGQTAEVAAPARQRQRPRVPEKTQSAVRHARVLV